MSEHIKIEGMGCARCVASVKAALEELPGVKVLGVELGDAEVELADDDARARRRKPLKPVGLR